MNYLEAVKKDISENYGNEIADRIREGESLDRIKDKIYDRAWCDDSITGNASGSYTFNTCQARENVEEFGLGQLIEELRDEFGCDPAGMLDKIINDEWEWFDVSARCLYVGQAVDQVVDEIAEEVDDIPEEVDDIPATVSVTPFIQ